MAARPEWFIKTAIVILGASLGVKAAGATGLVSAIMFRGLAAIIEAYLTTGPWCISSPASTSGSAGNGRRRWLRASRSAACRRPLPRGRPSGPRPVVPIMVSSLVVIFSVFELICCRSWPSISLDEPMVAAAWMGLAVKTDGAAVASGAITDALIRSRAAGAGIHYEAGWLLTTTTTVKIFIDVFIGVWALVLAAVWAYGIEKERGQTVPFAEILRRFPRFVVGYFALFLLLFGIALVRPGSLKGLKDARPRRTWSGASSSS